MGPNDEKRKEDIWYWGQGVDAPTTAGGTAGACWPPVKKVVHSIIDIFSDKSAIKSMVVDPVRK